MSGRSGHWRWPRRFSLRRAFRNGYVWIEHSLSFRDRERLFIPDERWKTEARGHYARLQLPAKASDFLVPLIARVRAGVDAVAAATRTRSLRRCRATSGADDRQPDISGNAHTKVRNRSVTHLTGQRTIDTERGSSGGS